MEIDNIKNYISDTNHNSFMEIANELYELTSWLNKTYPGYKEWFYNNQHIFYIVFLLIWITGLSSVILQPIFGAVFSGMNWLVAKIFGLF